MVNMDVNRFVKFLPVLNFDETYRQSVNPMIIPCGAETVRTKGQVSAFMQYIFTNSELYDVMVASCECGATVGENRLDTFCPKCGHVVKSHTSTEVVYSAWLHIPEPLPPVLQPLVYHTLKEWMRSYNSKPLLDILLTPSNSHELPEPLKHFHTGPTAFYTHFDEIIEAILTTYTPLMEERVHKRTGKITIKQQSKDMREYLQRNRDAIFTRYYPALDKSLHVLTKQGESLHTADDPSQFILKAALELANVNTILALYPDNFYKLELGAQAITQAYAEYANTILVKNLLTKPGYIRRHILGSRLHFSFRAVITPIVDRGRFDDIYIPWRVGVLQFKLQIINLLITRYHMSFLEAVAKHQRSLENYDEDIDNIFKTLIYEAPGHRIPMLIGRNPYRNWMVH